MIDNLDAPIDTLEGAWTPEDEHSTADVDEPARGAAHVEQSRGGPPAAGSRHPKTVQYASTMGVGDVPSVPVAGARIRRSDAAVDDGGIRRLCEPGPGAASRLLIRRVEDRDGRVLFAAEESSTRAISETTAFLMTTMLADVINAGTGARARGARASRCRPPARPARPTIITTPGSSGLRRRSSPASGLASISRARSCATASPATSPCRSGRRS